jgi:acetate kinase
MASSMGFSTLEGLPMATRCGHLDPGILLGLSGSSGDMHVLLATDSEAARFAVDFFCYRAAREAGSLLAALEGLDALVFCGGIGEHRPAVRENIVRRLAWLGMELDAEANLRGDAVISTAASALPVLVIRTDEQQELLHAALECLP